MSMLAIYKFIFITEIIIAEGLFMYKLSRRKYFAARLVLCIAVCYLLTALFPVFPKAFNGWYVSFMFLTLFAVTLGGAVVCFSAPLKNVFFCCLAAYTAQHLAYELFKLILSPFDSVSAGDMYGTGMIELGRSPSAMVIAIVVGYVDLYIAVYALSYFFIGKKISDNGDLRVKNTSLVIFSAIILLVDIILNAFTVYIDEDYNFVYDVIICVYNTLCCVLVFFIQNSVIKRKGIYEELEVVSALLATSEKQYEMRKEEIDLINIKCHDMKQRIAVSPLDEATKSEIAELVSIYDANLKTGNQVVDIILTEKNLICHANGVQLTCMADCSALGFVSEGDLYSLFGNILDNAVAAVLRIGDVNKRGISLHVRSQSGVISIMAENRYEGEISLGRDGLPRTIKEDGRNHGFGLKSIRAVAEKYGGNAVFGFSEEIFTVNVLLPVPSGNPSSCASV